MRLLVAVVVLAVTGEAFAAPPVLDGIEVVGTHATAVRLHLSGPALANARSLAPSGGAPDRIYVDLAGTILAPTLSRLVTSTGTGSLLRVRAGQFDRATVRVVLDLAGALPFTLHQTEQTVTIELGAHTASAPPQPPKTSSPFVAATARPAEIARGAPPPPAAPIAQPKTTPPPAVPAPAEAATAAPVPPRSQPAGARPVLPAAEAHPTAAADNVHGGDRTAATAPAAVAVAPPTEAVSPRPAAPAEHRAPASVTAAAPEPAAEPIPQAPFPPPALPPPFPSLSALPGALVALQNGREPTVPPGSEQSPPPTAAPPPPAPPSLAAAAPSSHPEPPPPVPSLVGPPSPPAGPPEPTRTARATPPPPAEHGGSTTDVRPAAERPRTPAPTVTVSRRPTTRQPHPLIVLDAGHGGRDPGAEGVGGVLEKDVVLEITRLIARRLAARLPVDVLMTRSDDSFIPIERRLALPGEGATLFISLHANACTDPTARGLEVFYGGGEVRTASTRGSNGPAALLGRCLNKALEARIGGVRGGARPGGFGVLVRNPVPSALIEIGYLTHPGEAARAQDTGFHELLADAVVEAVSVFLRASAPRL